MLFSSASAIASESDRYRLPARISESARPLLEMLMGGTYLVR